MKKVVLLLVLIHAVHYSFSQHKTVTENFLDNVGDSVVVSGKVYGGAFLVHVNTKPTFLNLGDTSSKHRLIIRIEPQDRDKFPAPPEIYYLNKIVQVTGKLQEYKGSPLIQVSDPQMMQANPSATPPVTSANTPIANGYTSAGAAAPATVTPSVITPSLRMIVPDSVLQSTWIKSVAEKAAEEKKRNVRLVEKQMDLRTAPFGDAPVIAELQPGMLISVLYTSKKWSYISIGAIDGFYNVNGFIKHKRFRHLKKVDPKS